MGSRGSPSMPGCGGTARLLSPVTCHTHPCHGTPLVRVRVRVRVRANPNPNPPARHIPVLHDSLWGAQKLKVRPNPKPKPDPIPDP